MWMCTQKGACRAVVRVKKVYIFTMFFFFQKVKSDTNKREKFKCANFFHW